MIRRPPRSTQSRSSAASDVYKRQYQRRVRGEYPRRMGFTRFVEMGRVVLTNYGPDAGKLGMITDVIDQNRCVIFYPGQATKQEMSYKRLSLTDLKVPLQRGARTKTAKAAWESSGVEAKWESSSWARKIAARNRKTTCSDFDRFKAMVARKKK
eukprot:TRINITY_DN76_c0_g1_i1.p1 TRINITY_DN76_c0_g1~~TRINITY_DN76_c0_g1_i1.p1  ORF type:complete len:154 (+),score=62.51 TRINITY_DN76_c0_g1_i1:147-608(+)